MKSLSWLLQVVVSLALLTVIALFIDLNSALRSIAGADPYLLVLSAVVLALQPIISAFRWMLIATEMHGILRPKIAIMGSFAGAFLNQLLPGAISGDAVRLWVAYRHGNTMRTASISVVIDRIVMLAVLLMLGSIGAAWFLDIEPYALRAGFAAGVTAVTAMFISLLWLDRIVVRLHRYRAARALSYLAKDTRLVLSGRNAVFIVALCIASYVNLIVSIYIITRAIGIDVGFLPLAMMLPAVFLASVVPASFGGWGAREAGMIIGMGWLHVEAGPALTTSILFGVASLVAASPGLLFYRALKRPSNAAIPTNIEIEGDEPCDWSSLSPPESSSDRRKIETKLD